MIRAIILAAGLLVASQALAAQPNLYATATACLNKGREMKRINDALDAWTWFCMEQNHFKFSQTLCSYSPAAIYKPECWTLNTWPIAEAR